MSGKKDRYLISELAESLGITTRSIRYYEKRGLIAPSRNNGNYRIFTRKDRVRLKLIQRGKRLGYSLDEIREMIGLWNTEPDEMDQIKKSLLFGEKKLREIENNIKELNRLKADLQSVRKKLTKRLSELEKEDNPK